MNRKTVVILIIVLAMSVLATACGGEGAEPPPPVLLVPPEVTAEATVQPTIASPTQTAESQAESTAVVDTANQVASSQSGVAACTKQTTWPSYTVQAGDTLGTIAQRTNSTIAELTRANCLTNPSLIHVGNQLYVPNFPATPIPATAVPPPQTGTKTFTDLVKRITFQYPAAWQEVDAGVDIRFEGETGYVQVGLMGSAWNVQETAVAQANHRLMPFGPNPSITSFWLRDGREGRLIMPGNDPNTGNIDQALLIFPYGDPIRQDDVVYNYLILYAHKDFINDIGSSLIITPGQMEPTVTKFLVNIEDSPSGSGKLVTFSWDSSGATRGTLHSGRAQRFDSWWPVVPSGEMKVELSDTIFPNPTATLHLINDINGRETHAYFQIPWECEYEFFFPYETGRCPYGPAKAVNSVYQNFEHGFMVWLPASTNGNLLPQIYVFFADGRLRLFSDTWTENEPEIDDSINPPENLYQPVRGFGKVWRENPEIREQLGWATQQEFTFESVYQSEIRESIPGVAYLRLPNEEIVKLIDVRWEPFP